MPKPKPKAPRSLTALRCQSAPPGRHSDGHGLYLEVKRSGTRSWALIYQIDGKRRQMGLGPFPEVSLADARQRAADKRLLIKRDKVDPLLNRGKNAASNRTFRQYAEDYIALRVPTWRNSKSAAQWKSTLRDYVYDEIGETRVASIESDDIHRLLTKNNLWLTKHDTASRTRGRVEKILNFAKAKGATIFNNPAEMAGNLEDRLPDIKLAKRVQHLKSLSYKLAPSFLSELVERDEISAKAMIWVLLTACRTGNVRSMRWDQLQAEEGLWVCPAEEMKANVEHRVPLSEEMIAWIETIPRIGELVFATGDGSKPMSDNTLLALLRRMGYTKKDTTTHGLRSTFSTWANEKTNYQNDVIEAALAHKIGNKTAQAYNRSDLLDKRRDLMKEWQDYLGFK